MRSYTGEVVRRLSRPPFQGRVREIGAVGHGGARYPIVAAEWLDGGAKPCAFISAGIHGNEPSGVWALLDFAEQALNAYVGQFDFVLLPCMNPAGFERESRANSGGVDLNRNFLAESAEREVELVRNYISHLGKKFVVSVELHEDPTDEPEPGFALQDNPLGFYLYESAPSQAQAGPLVISCLEREHIEIAPNKSIYGDRCEHGVIRVDNLSAWRARGAFDEYMAQFTSRTLVLETPTRWPLETRKIAHQTALSCVLGALSDAGWSNGAAHGMLGQ